MECSLLHLGFLPRTLGLDFLFEEEQEILYMILNMFHLHVMVYGFVLIAELLQHITFVIMEASKPG